MNLSIGRSINLNDNFGDPLLVEHFTDNNVDAYNSDIHEFADSNLETVSIKPLKTNMEIKVEDIESKQNKIVEKQQEIGSLLKEEAETQKIINESVKVTLAPIKLLKEETIESKNEIKQLKKTVEDIEEKNKQEKNESKTEIKEVKKTIKSIETNLNSIKLTDNDKLSNLDTVSKNNSLEIINLNENLNSLKEDVNSFKPYVLDTVKKEVSDYVKKYDEQKPPVLVQIGRESMTYFFEGLLLIEDRIKENSSITAIITLAIIYVVYNLFVDTKKLGNKQMEGGALNYLMSLTESSDF